MIQPQPIFGELTRYHFVREIEQWGWSIGAYSYGRPTVLEPDLARLRIGRFCSIGPGVTIVLGNHRTDGVTTYPFKAIAGLTGGGVWAEARACADDHASRGDVVIGDEVWLGAHCTVLSGVTIGSGAVIGAGAVVRRDVPPYAVVTGNPAAVVRTRFDEATVARLLALDWWSWPEARIAEHLPLLLGGDVAAFLAAAENPGGKAARKAKDKTSKGEGGKAKKDGKPKKDGKAAKAKN
ncbi:CatB-related O-acetyltransferase [Methylobacterium organophilum]|uniref:2,3,4,5-tetrahydropyridine-2,6-dicarboxylate N-acetyltransferase n=1 Tax=Methylobacterium organophilum TaxID=410 RepID=A0ABQ4TBN0_METOR|nr:CatB-related O-acetyltransferase [Methylobacterium organophilum]GJE29085.1 2,3,4,5-tetrahydropyridine-2,6-dicarboxylate N-acetyltransferase [Methylobacterium organophilum]